MLSFLVKFCSNFTKNWILREKTDGVRLCKNVVTTRKDIIDFLGLEDCEDDGLLNKMNKKNLFTMLNDGFKTEVDRDVFILQFPLIVRILHKLASACILPKKGSKTSISIEEGKIIIGMLKGNKIDIAGKILNHSFNNKERRPYGSLIMNLLKKKKVKIPEKSFKNFPVKKFDKSNLHHMGIHVRKNIWISNDLAVYYDARYTAREIPEWLRQSRGTFADTLKKKSHLETHSEGLSDNDKKAKLKRKGNELAERRKKQKHDPIRTPREIEIREGGLIESEDSDSDESDLNMFHQEEVGETSTKSNVRLTKA